MASFIFHTEAGFTYLTVTIATREYPDRYEITVSDDGPGFEFDYSPPKEDGRAYIGIQNVRERLKDVCGGELHIESVQGKGTKAVIILQKMEEGIPDEGAAGLSD